MSDVKIGLIGGTGLGDAIGDGSEVIRHVIDTPFGSPSDAILETNWSGLPVFFLSRHGPGHLLRPSVVPYRANVFALKKLGVTHILASGAVGSLRQELKPRDLVIVDQIIDKTTQRPGTFYEKSAVHVEFAEPFCPVLRQILTEAGANLGGTVLSTVEKKPGEGNSGDLTPPPAPGNPTAGDLKTGAPHSADVNTGFTVHDSGCYVAMEGPAFSTRAESLMHRLWGGDLIGMTAMPEAKLAKEAEIAYALVALVTDYDSWKVATVQKDGKVEPAPPPDPTVLLSEIIGNIKSAGTNAIALLRKAVDLMAANPRRLADSPAQHALRMAIWSDKSKIDLDEQQRLAPLWLKYFVGS